MAQTAQADAEAGAGGRTVTLDGHFEIFVDRPLPELRAPHAAAHEAIDGALSGQSLFALVCDPDRPPRSEAVGALRGLRLPAMFIPVGWGVVDWPPAGRRCFAVIYDRPIGGPLVAGLDDAVARFSEHDLIDDVLPPLVASLRDFFAAGLTHRAIRPTNLFYRAAGRRSVMLGDCCTTPPGLSQPVACETIESGLADPWARGAGQPADDLYALGVTLVFLLLGRNPAAGISDEQLILAKINRGSYAAILGNERLSPAMIEPIRGLLTDDTKERWSIQDLEMWLQGRRLSPKQPTLPKRASRAFDFGGAPYFTARSLAHAFARQPEAAVQAFKGQDLEIWLQRSLKDPDRTKTFALALSEGPDSGATGHDDRRAARVCAALDPAAPIRYKDLSVAIDGFGSALASAFRGRGSVAVVSEAISSRLPAFWFAVQAGFRPEQVPILKSFERLRLHLEDRRLGFGPERAAYEMNPWLHCLSPLVEAQYVLGLPDLLHALEIALDKRPNEEVQIDRHLAAFIGARFKAAANESFDELDSANPADRTLGTLRVLARIQAFRGPRVTRTIAQRLARQLPAVIDTYHNRRRRGELATELPKVAERGSLIELLNLVDSVAERQRDAVGFNAAAREYAQIGRTLDRLRLEVPKRPARAAQLGAQLASAAAILLAWTTALLLLVAMS